MVISMAGDYFVDVSRVFIGRLTSVMRVFIESLMVFIESSCFGCNYICLDTRFVQESFGPWMRW